MRATGAVAAGHPLTAEAAREVLVAGGNAFDAALAALCMACVAEPVLASLGGGGFLLAHSPGDPRLYDFFVQTPQQRQPDGESDFRPILADFGETQQEFHVGLGSIAVPGVVRGLFEVHHDLGRMPLLALMAPAIRAARQGVEVNSLQAFIFGVVAPIYRLTHDAEQLFGQICEGERFCQSELADLLEVLALEGPDLFYRGELSASLDRLCQTGGGHLRRADLESYQLERRRPLRFEYRDCTLYSNPPPSSGGVLIAFALQLLQESRLAVSDFGSSQHLKLLAEVMALTDQARQESVGESGEPLQSERLLHPDYLQLYRQQVAGAPPAHRGTTHISVMDGDGNSAALTLSNGEGCGTLLPGSGVMLNNMLGEADLNPQGFQRWPTAVRMTSMMAPTLLLDRRHQRTLAIGSGGSNRIRSAILQVLLNLIDFELGPEAAVAAARLHYEEGLLNLEPGFAAAQLEPLLNTYPRHKLWGDHNLFFGGTHLVMADGSGFSGAGDPRRGGVCYRF